MIVKPMTPEDRAERQAIVCRAEELKEAGICPTCHNLEHGEVYPPVEDRVICEDDVVVCFLERYPHNPGHTIVLVKAHFEDLSEMPAAVAAKVYPAIHRVIGALKEACGAEKVYLCTMCDGERNHLHYQLIPRLVGDKVTGSRLFVKPRGVLWEQEDVVEELRSLLGHTPAR